MLRYTRTLEPTALVQRTGKEWLERVLQNPNLDGPSLPSSLENRAVLYDMNGKGVRITPGTWQQASNSIYMAGVSPDIPVFDRLSILAQVAGIWGLTQDPVISELLIQSVLRIIKSLTMLAGGNLMEATHPCGEIAISPDFCQVAAKLEGVWRYQAGGVAPVMPDWLILEL